MVSGASEIINVKNVLCVLQR